MGWSNGEETDKNLNLTERETEQQSRYPLPSLFGTHQETIFMDGRGNFASWLLGVIVTVAAFFLVISIFLFWSLSNLRAENAFLKSEIIRLERDINKQNEEINMNRAYLSKLQSAVDRAGIKTEGK